MYPKMKMTSASGIISLLEEDRPELKSFALSKLNDIVDEFWAEISEVIEKIEVLYEDESFQMRKLASLVASKVYYHLGSFEGKLLCGMVQSYGCRMAFKNHPFTIYFQFITDSLTYALGAEDLFDVNDYSEYISTIIAKCIDHYTKLRVKKLTSNEVVKIDPRLEDIVNRMFKRCYDDGQYKQAIGIAMETRRMDIFERAILESDNVTNMLDYAFKIAMSLVENRHYRNDILKILVNIYKNLKTPDYVNMCQCLIFLDDAQSVANILDKLVREDETSCLMAYQIAFDLYESATQNFLIRVLQAIKTTAPIPSLVGPPEKPNPEEGSSSGTAPSGTENMDVDQSEANEQANQAITPQKPSEKVKKEDLSVDDKNRQDRLEKLAVILSGETTIELELQFLIRNNHTDMLILKHTKDAVRNSVCHTATVIANSIMHCGTTSHQFLRDNLDWLARAVNWAKFTATASLGVIHKGHEKEALSLMEAYLPKDSGPGSGFIEGLCFTY